MAVHQPAPEAYAGAAATCRPLPAHPLIQTDSPPGPSGLIPGASPPTPPRPESHSP
jgi:hypothetical protein